jgi:hypothetical protein
MTKWSTWRLTALARNGWVITKAAKQMKPHLFFRWMPTAVILWVFGAISAVGVVVNVFSTKWAAQG